MPPIAARFLSPLLATGLAGGLYLQMRPLYGADEQTQRTVEAFHAGVRDAVAQVPMHIGDFDGVDVAVPAAAGTLLHPNVILSRMYTGPQGRRIRLILVHCRDSRDMSGHYPPNCYPGSGWTQKGPVTEHTYRLWDRQVPVAQYEFVKGAGMDRQIDWFINDFFVLPAGGMCTSMTQVRKAGGDYRTRPYGAAQIQVAFDASIPEAERTELLKTILAPLGPVIDRLQISKQGDPS